MTAQLEQANATSTAMQAEKEKLEAELKSTAESKPKEAGGKSDEAIEGDDKKEDTNEEDKKEEDTKEEDKKETAKIGDENKAVTEAKPPEAA